jgi:hypothetical protein
VSGEWARFRRERVRSVDVVGFERSVGVGLNIVNIELCWLFGWR